MRQREGQRATRWAIWLTMLALMIGIVALPGTASGQHRPDAQAELEKTDDLLEQARDLVRDFGSERGRNALELAEQMQRRAWDSFHRGRGRMAQQMTERAREEIYRALGSVRRSEENENEVERQLERTDAVLAEAQDRLGMSRAQGPRRRLETAMNSQRRAWELFRDRRLRPALRLTLQARETVVRMASGHHGAGPRADLDARSLEARLQRLTEAANRVENRIQESDDATAAEAWRRTTEMLERARTALNSGDMRDADRLLRQARERLERIARTTLREMRSEEVEILIDAATARWERLESMVRDHGEERLIKWHRQAGEDLQQARQALGAGRTQQALLKTRQAVELLDRIEHDRDE